MVTDSRARDSSRDPSLTGRPRWSLESGQGYPRHHPCDECTSGFGRCRYPLRGAVQDNLVEHLDGRRADDKVDRADAGRVSAHLHSSATRDRKIAVQIGRSTPADDSLTGPLLIGRRGPQHAVVDIVGQERGEDDSECVVDVAGAVETT